MNQVEWLFKQNSLLNKNELSDFQRQILSGVNLEKLKNNFIDINGRVFYDPSGDSR